MLYLIITLYSEWGFDQPDEKRRIRILALLESVRLCTMRKPASIISLNTSGNIVTSAEASAKLCNNKMIDSNDRYAANTRNGYQHHQRNEDNVRRRYRQHETGYQDYIISKLPEKSFTR